MSLITEIRCDAHGCEERVAEEANLEARGWAHLPEFSNDPTHEYYRHEPRHLCPKHVKLALAAVERPEKP